MPGVLMTYFRRAPTRRQVPIERMLDRDPYTQAYSTLKTTRATISIALNMQG